MNMKEIQDRAPRKRQQEETPTVATVAQKIEILKLLNEEWVTSRQKDQMILAMNSMSKERAARALQVMRYRKELYERSHTLGAALFEDERTRIWLNGAGLHAGDRVISDIGNGRVVIQRIDL